MRLYEVIRPSIRPALAALRQLASFLVAALNVLALVGHVARDRTLVLAFLMYLPLFPIGIVAAGAGLLHRRSNARWLRGFLIALGVCSVLLSASWMIGRGASPSLDPGRRELTVLHWNVLWGGFWRDHDFMWKSMVQKIIDRDPDILVLSEAPPLARMYQEFERLPGRRFRLSIQAYGKLQACHMFVAARWPLRLEREVPIAHGAAAVLVVNRPDAPVRLMLVDGQSNIRQSRTPMLHDIARTCSLAYAEGNAIDLVVGDFNSVSRSIGFDALEAAGEGYDLASRSCLGWRGTWPFPLPFLDIDHVWARTGWRIAGCELFEDFGTDHRGQFVRLDLPGS